MPYANDATFATDPRLLPPTDPFYPPPAFASSSSSCDASANTSRSVKRKREPLHDSSEPADGLSHQEWTGSYSSPPVYPDSFAMSAKGAYPSADAYAYPIEQAPDPSWSSTISAYAAPFSQTPGATILHHPHHEDPAAQHPQPPPPPPYLHPDPMYDGLPPMSSFRSSSQFAADHPSSLAKALYSAPEQSAYPPAVATPVSSSPSTWTRLPTPGAYSGPTASEPASVLQTLHPIVSRTS